MSTGINVIKNKLRYKRVLLILDDVDDWGQLKALAGNCDWFGSGSRFIITRDQNLLSNHKVDATYEVEKLSHYEALKLFIEMERLRKLSLAYTDIKELPLSIGQLIGLEVLDLIGCKNLVHLPTGIL
ncbi:disease resistance protein Roq1-like [Carya illinoinensis]|uniref:disease resistance protein Roq1-like n=1 Tax=Carya illinoinensis TaxID=32201 RepID=UPI001C729905|nr:disease resistance protein Roq1-like [Carya illinoinensis]